MLGVKGSGGRIGKCLIGFFLILYFAHPGYAQSISNMKSLLSEQGQILFGDEPNSVLIVDYPENIERIDEYLQMVDVEPQQVHIEARVVEVKLQGETSLGIDWTAFANSGGLNFGNFDMFSGTAASGITTAGVTDYTQILNPPITGSSADTNPFALTLSHNNIDVVMRALANDYDTDILSAPSITTINNHTATIKMIDIYPWAEPTVTTVENSNPEISYEMNFEEAGIVLQVTPIISENGKVVLDLQPEISEKTDDYSVTIDPGGGSQTITYTVPIIETRQTKTKVVVNSGETLIIGGLIKNKEIESEIKIPLLGDIPYLGYLFKSQRKTMDKKELVIFVSPTIIRAPEMAYSGKLERKIRKDVEGSESKLEMVPMKEVGPRQEAKDAARAAAEKMEQDLRAEMIRQEEEAKAERIRKKEEAVKRKVNNLYAQAVSAYADGNLEKAKNFFQEVLRYDPEHKGSLRFLETKIPEGFKERKVYKQTAQPARKVKVKPTKVKGNELETKDKERAINKKEEARVDQERKNFQATIEKQKVMIRQEEKDKQVALKKQAASIYSDAISLYRSKNYSEAQVKFQEVESILPGYSRTEYYLKNIPRLLEEQVNQKEAAVEAKRKKDEQLKAKNLYSAAVSLYREKQYEAAYAKFQKLAAFSPGYSNSDSYLAKIPGLIESDKRIKRAKEARERELAIDAQTKDYYNVAISLYKVKKYKEALTKFQEVQKLMPGYRETTYYLNKIPEIIKRHERTNQLRYKKDRQQTIKEMLDASER
ncbi:MAG: hypothetical protein K9L86_01790 [Candidatus Omnitrophica bacterium]|nr:hypothetical protein [Candidatus Omnitrophota bacterium]